MRWKWSASVAAIAILGAIAAALIAWGFPWTPDGVIHARWTHHFAKQLWEGDFYPRWLVGTNYGFGSATFWYYPPFGVWMASLFNPVAPTPWHALGWSTTIALVASAFTSHLLFRRRVSAKAAMVAAFCYAVAPYGISCLLFAQGAYAQFWALAWMPLVLYAIDRSPRTSIGGIGVLSIALALLFTTHVLTAIVFAPLAFCYALFGGRKPTMSLCLAFFVALGLTAVYWLPIPWVEARIAGGEQPFFQGEMLKESLFFQGGIFQEAKPFSGHFFLVSYLLLFFIYYLACWWGVIERKRWRWPGWMLMGLGLIYLLMQTPLAMPIYEAVPPLRRIQFVWRFMSPATVAATLMIGLLLHGWRRQGSSARMMAGMASGLWLACAIGLVGFELSEGYGLMRKSWSEIGPPETDYAARDAAGEYIPRRADLEEARKFFDRDEGLEQSRVVAGQAEVEVDHSDYELRIDAQAATSCTIVLHQFFFPGWSANRVGSERAVEISRHPGTGLIQLELPAGAHELILRYETVPIERVGGWISLIFAAGLAGYWLLRGGRRCVR